MAVIGVLGIVNKAIDEYFDKITGSSSLYEK